MNVYGPQHIQTAFSFQFSDSSTWMPLADAEKEIK